MPLLGWAWSARLQAAPCLQWRKRGRFDSRSRLHTDQRGRRCSGDQGRKHTPPYMCIHLTLVVEHCASLLREIASPVLAHSEKKNLFFKATRIRRVYDEASQTLLYISYSTNWSSGTDDQSDPNSRQVIWVSMATVKHPRRRSIAHSGSMGSCRYRTSVAALPLFQAVQPSTQASTR